MRLRVAVLALLMLGVSCGFSAKAQLRGSAEGGQENGPPVAMGGGRMVRGTISAVENGRITLKTEQGDLYQVTLTPNTRLVKGRDPVKIADVHVGDGIGAMGELDVPNKTVHALFVSVVDAAKLKEMRDSLGKTWIAGKVTAIDDLKLTILRSDKVSQVIAVDEDTSFRRGGRGMQQFMRGDSVVPMPPADGRPGGTQGPPGGGGESITLADIKVGDNVGGEGALKNGLFVPTQLVVADPNARRRRPGDGTAPNAASEPK
jgi:hypothetical protein